MKTVEFMLVMLAGANVIRNLINIHPLWKHCAIISAALLLNGCEVYNGLRIANNPNNYDGQWKCSQPLPHQKVL